MTASDGQAPGVSSGGPEPAGAGAPGRLASQPLLGIAGLLLVLGPAAGLAVGLGGPRPSLELVGPLTTYALPVLVMIALWWDGWPGDRLGGPWGGLANTAIVLGAAMALTMLGQLVVGRLDLSALVTARPAEGHLPLYPALMPLAATAFVTFLQFTLVCEKWPCDRLGPRAGGLAAVALSWAVAVAVYLLLVNVDGAPANLLAGGGLRNPGGPVAAADLATWLVALTTWQVVVAVALGGWPFSAIGRRGRRLAVANGAVLALGTATFLVLCQGLGWAGPQVTALGGCAVAASLLLVVLFDGWPGPDPRSPRGAAVVLALVAAAAVALDVGLTALGRALHEWTAPTVEEWVTLTALNFLPVAVVLHVAHWRRWPLLPTPPRR